jgi:hypothetical protein
MLRSQSGKVAEKTVALVLGALMVLSLVTSCSSNVSEPEKETTVSGSAKETADVSVIDRFNEPDAKAKPMARMWFPDAGAGEDPDDLIEKQILELAEKGFGGVEVAMLADGVSYDNAGGKAYGWGTGNWRKLLKKVLKAAAKVPGGFQVDMTITAHWPPTLNTLDPNDEAANKEISYSLTKITGEDLAGGRINLQLPQQKTDGPTGGFGGRGAYEHFLFTDTFISATIAQVSEIKMIAEKSASPFPMPGAGKTEAADPVTTPRYVFDFGTLKTITADVTATAEGGYAAGVPDRATAAAYGWNYDDICEFFGPESDGPWVSDNGKLDAESNRKRMADWQDQYAADLTGVALEGIDNAADIKPGDWVVVSTFYRGTGQSIPGGRIMHNGVFVTNYYNEAGTKALTDFWDNMLANDPELLELMKANKGYIFEDSIESSSVSSYWASTLLDDVSDDYAYKEILPLVAASQYLSSGFMGTTLTDFFGFEGDNGLAGRIYEDYCDTLAELYVRYRVTGMVEWAESTLGWGFRGQTYHLPGLEISRAAMVADVAECDNMSKGDGVRYQAGTVNITNRDFLTMEAITGPSIGYVTMDDVITEVGQNFSDGVNRVILHGTPYAKTFNGYNSDWPGWLPFGPSSFGSAYTYRQAYWDDAATETAYMARIQAVLQEGEAQVDLAVLIDKKHTFDFESGNRFQNLLDAGFSYNLISEATMTGEDAVVAGGRLAPDGPAYKALIVDEVSILSLEGIEKLIRYAEDGLPVVVYKSDIGRVYGSNVADDAAVEEKFTELIGKENVITAANLEELETALSELGTLPYARYNASQLETTLYRDTSDGTNYYYIFNNAYPENSGMMGNNQGAFYKGEDKVVKNAVITLAGDGVPYKLDPHNGEIVQVGAYIINGDGSVTFEIDELAGGDGIIYAITKDTGIFPAEDVYVEDVEQSTDAYAIVRTDDGLALRSDTADEYVVALSDGTMETVTVAEALDAVDLGGEKWELTIKSYEPAGDQNDPSKSKITTVDFGTQMPGKWKDLPATAEQLAELGVENIRNVSGVGEYTLTFTTPANWSETTGAFLDVAYGMDQIGSYTVNGVTIQANNASDRVDLGGLLVPGENTITVRLSTSLYGRMFVENSGYASSEFGMSGGFMAPMDPDAYYNGLLGVTLTPYTQINLGE